jgi:hypothetical protein
MFTRLTLSVPLAAVLFAQQASPPQTAEQVYKNIQILKGLPAARIPVVMGVFNRVLGVQCTHCHVEDAMEKEDKPAFATTRKMFQMRNWFAQTQKVNVACWSCHRGSVNPNSPAPTVKDQWPPDLKLSAGDSEMAATKVYKNLRFFTGTAGQLGGAMNFMASALGVGCVYCHVEGAWEKDEKPAKEAARKMLAMVRDSRQEFKGLAQINCFTCHHGAPKPEINPPAA